MTSCLNVLAYRYSHEILVPCQQRILILNVMGSWQNGKVHLNEQNQPIHLEIELFWCDLLAEYYCSSTQLLGQSCSSKYGAPLPFQSSLWSEVYHLHLPSNGSSLSFIWLHFIAIRFCLIDHVYSPFSWAHPYF